MRTLILTLWVACLDLSSITNPQQVLPLAKVALLMEESVKRILEGWVFFEPYLGTLQEVGYEQGNKALWGKR